MEHLTPAQQHWQRVMAARRGESDDGLSIADLTAYENMLHRLRADQSQLSHIQGNDRKAKYKLAALPNYHGWIDGVLASQPGMADEVFTTVMIWQIDVGHYAVALQMAEYALKHSLPLPDNYNRTLASVLIDEICDWTLTVMASGKEDEPKASLDVLLELERITEPHDMPNAVRSKLYKTLGQTLKTAEATELQAQALDYLQRAILTDKDAGVKKDIEFLQRALRKQENTQLNTSEENITIGEENITTSDKPAKPKRVKKTIATRAKKAKS